MTKVESLTLELSEISHETKGVGIKSANLGELLRNNFPVPDGFVIKTGAFRYV